MKNSSYIHPTLGCLLLLFFLASCSWVKDDRSDCPTGTWLQLEYTYNMLDVDAAAKQIDEATVMVYDTAGVLVRNIQVTKAELQQNDYRVELKDLPEGDYRLLVWSGLSDSHYMASGNAQFEDFRLHLITDAHNTVADNVKDLFHGSLGSIHIDNRYAVHRVSMHKDVNRIACIIEAQSETQSVNTNIYTMELVADNTQLDASNNIVSTASTHYLPYIARDTVIIDEELGERHVAEFSIATMRLLEQDNARLILKLKDTDYEVFNIPASQYIAQVASLYELNGRPLTAQEYLDRQDLFTFVFCLASTGSADGSAIFRCKVNNWVIRKNENIKF